MKEYPILMSAPMVRAMLAGRKTVTWRLDVARWSRVNPGDRIWVNETWRTPTGLDDLSPSAIPSAITYKEVDGIPWCPIEYVADGARKNWLASFCDDMAPGRTRVSIHMCRWMSRIVREVVSVRTERLHAITHDDAIAEGVPGHVAYANLWDSLNVAPGTRWADNPTVVRVEFSPNDAVTP